MKAHGTVGLSNLPDHLGRRENFLDRSTTKADGTVGPSTLPERLGHREQFLDHSHNEDEVGKITRTAENSDAEALVGSHVTKLKYGKKQLLFMGHSKVNNRIMKQNQQGTLPTCPCCLENKIYVGFPIYPARQSIRFANSLTDCQRHCENEETCKYFSYHLSMLQCFLKLAGADDNEASLNSVISGPKSCAGEIICIASEQKCFGKCIPKSSHCNERTCNDYGRDSCFVRTADLTFKISGGTLCGTDDDCFTKCCSKQECPSTTHYLCKGHCLTKRSNCDDFGNPGCTKNSDVVKWVLIILIPLLFVNCFGCGMFYRRYREHLAKMGPTEETLPPPPRLVSAPSRQPSRLVSTPSRLTQREPVHDTTVDMFSGHPDKGQKRKLSKYTQKMKPSKKSIRRRTEKGSKYDGKGTRFEPQWQRYWTDKETRRKGKGKGMGLEY